MSTDAPPLPTIEPTTFDLVLVGTGLPQSLLAAAAASIGRSVLHLDPNAFYGSYYSSLSPSSLAPSLLLPPLYSLLDPSDAPPDDRRFLLDASGPRLLYCAEPLVDVLLRSGASHHVEFKSVEATLLYSKGALSPVPDSREAVFKDRSLGLKEKGQMTRFLKLVRGHFEAARGGEGDGEGRIPDEDLEVPFPEFLDRKGLPPKIKKIVLYAIAMADWDQENPDECGEIIKAKEGLDRLALYNTSLGRFPNAVGAFIYPVYGHGELPQAFCRCAAVKGALYVLRMPVLDLLISEDNKHCKGVRLANGQDIFCSQLVVDPSFKPPSLLSSNASGVHMESTCPDKAGHTTKVARMVCITRCSIQSDLSNILVVFPPRSLHTEQVTTIRALQLSSNLAICPPGMFVVYLSTFCQNAIQGKQFLHAAFDALFMASSTEPQASERIDSEDVNESKPDLLWSIAYIQETSKVLEDSFFSCPMPDVSLDYRNLLDTTVKMFQDMYPNEAFIPEGSATGNNEDEEDPSE